MSPTRTRVPLVHPGHAILRLKPRRFPEVAASRLRKSLAADLARLSMPRQRRKEEVATSLAGPGFRSEAQRA